MYRPKHLHARVDLVSSEEDWQTAVDLSVHTYGASPNVLVQCAGISGKSRIHEATIEEWNRVFSVNCTYVRSSFFRFL